MKTRRHRIIMTLNTGTALLLAAALILMVNYLSYRHYYRTDWSTAKFYRLSAKTVSLLETLDKPVEVTVFFQPGNVLYEDSMKTFITCCVNINSTPRISVSSGWIPTATSRRRRSWRSNIR